MRIDEWNLTGLEDLSGLYDHVYTQRAILGDMLKFVRLVPLIPFLAFVSVSPIGKKTAKRGKESKQKSSWSEGCGCGRWSGGVVLWVSVPGTRCPIAGEVGVNLSQMMEIMRPFGVVKGRYSADGGERRWIARPNVARGGNDAGRVKSSDGWEFVASARGFLEDKVVLGQRCADIAVRERHARTCSPPEPPSEI